MQEATGNSCGGLPCGAALPAPDVTGTHPDGGSAGKVAVVTNQTTIPAGTDCPSVGIQRLRWLRNRHQLLRRRRADREPSSTTAAIRADAGCTDTDSSSGDFSVAGPSPRNASSPAHACTSELTLSIDDVAAAEGNAGTTTFNFTVSLSAPAGTGGVTFDVATADGTATTGDSDYASQSLTGQSIVEGESAYPFSVTVNGDAAVEAHETFLVNVTNVTGATVADGQGQGTIQNDDSNPCDDPFTPIFQIQGSGLERGAHRHAHDRGGRRGRLRGHGGEQRLLHPGSGR